MMKFNKTHEWIKYDDNSNIGTIGISEYAQSELGDIVFVELPDVGKSVNQGDEFFSIESVKTAADIYAPVGGSVIEINENVNSKPEIINESAEDKGWLVKMEIRDKSDLDKLISKEEYYEYVKGL